MYYGVLAIVSAKSVFVSTARYYREYTDIYIHYIVNSSAKVGRRQYTYVLS